MNKKNSVASPLNWVLAAGMSVRNTSLLSSDEKSPELGATHKKKMEERKLRGGKMNTR